MPLEKYLCPECGHDEFITQPNRYDVYLATEGKLYLQTTHFVDDEVKLFCRECEEPLVFDEDDVII